jgi:hypothetical protein
MSYSEYDDLFLKARQTGEYHIFLFDIKGSRKIPFNKRNRIQIEAKRLILSVYKRLAILEKHLGRAILHKSDMLFGILCGGITGIRGDMYEPFNVTGDCFGFTIIRGSIDASVVYDIFLEEKEKFGIECDFNYADGYYETDDYAKGVSEYFRGYCIQKLEEVSKKTGKCI